VNYGD